MRRVSSPRAGWYPDPSGAQGERWWNGAAWSDDTRVTPPAPGAGPGLAPPPYQPAAPDQPGQSGGQPGAGYGGYGAYGGPAQTPGGTSWASRNSLSLATIGIVVVYALLLHYAHVVFLGILPILLSVRAVRRKEQLAVPAVVVAVLAIVVGLWSLSR